MDKLKKIWGDFLSGLKSRRKWISFLVCLVVLLFGVWLFFSQTGELAQRSFWKSFGQEDTREQIVMVYNGGTEIARLKGHFSVENYQGRLVVIDRDNPGEYFDIYGSSAVVVQSSEDEFIAYSNEPNGK